MTEQPTRRPANDLRDDEPRAVLYVANSIRQAREGKPHDPWEWPACTQDDVDRARRLVADLTAGETP